MTDFFGTGFLETVAGNFPLYLFPLVLLVGGGLIVGLIYFTLRRRSLTTLYLKDPLFDGAPRSFYGLLDIAVREHFSLFRNIPVEDVIRYSGAVSPLPGKVRNSVFDLLLCDRRKMLPKCAIVLVEKNNSRDKETQQLRSFCDRVGLSLLVYETGGMIDVGRLRSDVYQAAGMGEVLDICGVLSDARGHLEAEGSMGEAQSAAVDSSVEGQEFDSDRLCKKCGSTMVPRTISKGKHAGRKALICETFPTCRYAVLSRETVE